MNDISLSSINLSQYSCGEHSEFYLKLVLIYIIGAVIYNIINIIMITRFRPKNRNTKKLSIS